MRVQYGGNYMGQKKIIEWMERFRRGQASVDDACSEQPVTVLS